MIDGSFFIVDVFSQEKYQGNQLAVVKTWPGLAGGEMQRIAKEMNYSETAFLMAEEPGEKGYPVRIFTPEHEVPFAGHPTLGAAFVIAREIAAQPVERLTLDLKAGPVPVRITPQEDGPDLLWMRQAEPVFGPVLDPGVAAEVLGLDLDDLEPGLPVQEVSTGLPFIVVGLKSLAAVKRAAVDNRKYLDFIENTAAKAILIFCRETYEPANDLNVRMFAGYYGVPEDPATGSANGCLAAYLVEHRVLGGERVEVRVEQGYEIGRRSLLFLSASARGDGGIEVNVGGSVVPVARGEFLD